MTKILFAFILGIVSICSWAKAELKLHFPQAEVKLGSLSNATLEIDPQSLQSFEIQKLKSSNPADLIYFHKLSPLMRNNGTFTSEVSVIFLKKPETNFLQFKIEDQEVRLSWNNIEVIPTESAKSFIFENFEIPGRKKILFWILIVLTLGALIAGGLYIRNRMLQSRKLKQKRLVLKDKILSARTYSEVVDVWKDKLLYQLEFPHTIQAFKNFEKVFFKVSFKPVQSDSEQEEVLKAYRTFINEVQEGLNGV